MKVGILGYGKMGRGIFSLFSASPAAVTVFVRSQEKADLNNAQSEKRLQRAVRKGMITEAEFNDRSTALKFTSNLNDLADCDLVIESVPENFETKVELLARIESVVRPDCILASNTSTLSINRMAAGLKKADRFCGFHFFHPVQLSGILEIIKWDRVSEQVVERMVEVSRMIQRAPIVVKDVPGSAINGVLSCYYCEGLYLLEQGLGTPSVIDRVAGRYFRIGPCESIDVIGVKFFTDSFERMEGVRPPGLSTPALLKKMIDAGRVGKDVNQGIYLYQEDRAVDDAPDYYLNPAQKHSRDVLGQGEDEIAQRLLYAVFAGMLFIVAQGFGRMPELDIGMKEVLGMERGPLEWMKSIGKARLTDDYKLLNGRIGDRFDPALLDYYSE